MKPRPIHLAAVVGLCICWGAVPAAFAEKGWKLEQSGDYLGPMTCFVGKRAIKMDLKRYGISFYLSSSDYKVIGYNDKTKTYFSEPYSAWKERFLSTRTDTLDKSDSVQQGTSTIANFKVKRFLVQSMRGPQAAAAPTYNGKSYNSEMFVTDEIPAPSQFVSLMTALTYLPSNLGFPIKVVRYSPMGTKTIAWNTLSSQRADVPDKFGIPKGYAPVDNELALFVGGTGETAMGEPATAVFEHGAHPSMRHSGTLTAPRWAPGMDADESDDLMKAETPTPHGAAPRRSGEWAPGF